MFVIQTIDKYGRGSLFGEPLHYDMNDMRLSDFTDEEIIAEYDRRMKLISEKRRKQKDHERYLRKRDAIIQRSKEYYQQNRERILQRKRDTGFLTYGEAH